MCYHMTQIGCIYDVYNAYHFYQNTTKLGTIKTPQPRACLDHQKYLSQSIDEFGCNLSRIQYGDLVDELQ